MKLKALVEDFTKALSRVNKTQLENSKTHYKTKYKPLRKGGDSIAFRWMVWNYINDNDVEFKSIFSQFRRENKWLLDAHIDTLLNKVIEY